jgi:hypothetical protein
MNNSIRFILQWEIFISYFSHFLLKNLSIATDTRNKISVHPWHYKL